MIAIPHPATAAWDQHRPDCEQCANLLRDGTALRCKLRLGDVRGNKRARGGYGYCIDERSIGACGPDALLWTKTL